VGYVVSMSFFIYLFFMFLVVRQLFFLSIEISNCFSCLLKLLCP
jgi:hypothetical protein